MLEPRDNFGTGAVALPGRNIFAPPAATNGDERARKRLCSSPLIDFGHDDIRVGVADLSFTLLTERRHKLDVDDEASEALDAAAAMANAAIAEAGLEHARIVGVGAALSAPVGSRSRTLMADDAAGRGVEREHGRSTSSPSPSRAATSVDTVVRDRPVSRATSRRRDGGSCGGSEAD